MPNEDNITRVQQFVSEINQGNLESVRTFIAPDFFNYSPKPDEPTAAEVYYDLVSNLKAAITDLHLAVENLSPVGDLLKGRMTLKGTHDGPLWGGPASGVPIMWEVDIAIRFRNGKFALTLENFAMPNLLPVLRQMDLLPERMDLPPKHPISLPEIILKVLFTGQMADKPCSHLGLIKVTKPETNVCEQCVSSGDIWPGLRMCLICGFVGCCDTAKNTHMKQHYEATGHMIFRSIRLEESWVWCYEDNAFFSGRILEK